MSQGGRGVQRNRVLAGFRKSGPSLLVILEGLDVILDRLLSLYFVTVTSWRPF